MPQPPTVSLRARTDADLDVLYEIAAELDTWENRGPEVPRPLTRDEWDARQARAGGDSGFPVSFVVDVDGAAAGSAGLFGFDPLARHAEAGISLHASARGRGIGTAAMTQLVEFGFVRCNLRRIHLQAVASNAAAVRSYEKAGFVLEGRLREHAWVRGAYEDMVVMAILRSQWSAPA
jgi:RimJ/RimL family protein N-acetyltransferase